jgi:predicted TIM-barrel fold metal-dependent hydrolase
MTIELTQMPGLESTVGMVTGGGRPGFDTRKHLRNAELQARERHYEKITIVDVDAHQYEGESWSDIFEYIEDPVVRHMAQSTPGRAGMTLLYTPPLNQHNAGRVAHYNFEKDEVPEEGKHLDLTRAERVRAAIGIDYQVVFPTSLLFIGLHPDPQVERHLAWAYTRWFTENILPHDRGIKHLVLLPFHDPEASLRMVETFSEVPGVIGFTVTTTRYGAVHDDRYMRLYDAIQEREMPLTFHAAFNQQERLFEGMNRFISVHALGFVLNTLVHATNVLINGLPERFPRLKWVWIESGLAWIPFLMQRLDDEFMKRSNEAPLLKARPSEYMREYFYYSSQPIELENRRALEMTLDMIKAETQLLYASDYPHWDFDLPSTIYDLPFLSQEAKVNILGGNALRVFPKLAEEMAAERQAGHGSEPREPFGRTA